MTEFPYDIVGFDLDGTLFDTLGDLGNALNHALALEGRAPLARPVVRTLVGGGVRKLLHRGLEISGGLPEAGRIEDLQAALLAFYEANIARETGFYPGGEAMLDALAARGVKVALVTNKLERLAVQLLRELGLSERFYTVIGGDTLGPGKAKPQPDLLDLMLDRAGGGRAVYVGDTSFDTGAARAAGIPCVVVSFGFNDALPSELDGAAVIDHFDELVPTLERIGARAGV
ncbi:HAD-IA family hydrolase [Novosphingobium sp. 1949]|uniref:phosphoglycolate phosphatase n=1 Tax=Novosphingobium organovorum TaxID=2930092 RepID=A0ABT0B992_9SPHN|nr:HAD-IA family hydrolase [Novosphingobium organovorum]MCJ2181607.1 HAD-IA family hydrolase [Novosphingobium organovorum]